MQDDRAYSEAMSALSIAPASVGAVEIGYVCVRTPSPDYEQELIRVAIALHPDSFASFSGGAKARRWDCKDWAQVNRTLKLVFEKIAKQEQQAEFAAVLGINPDGSFIKGDTNDNDRLAAE